MIYAIYYMYAGVLRAFSEHVTDRYTISAYGI